MFRYTLSSFSFMQNNKGFTLIELLIVIGITAFLFAALIITLNPAELLRQARDSTRISDLATLRSAIALYLSDVSSPNIASSTNGYTKCFQTASATTCGYAFSAPYVTTSTSQVRNVDATGWLPINFSSISTGSPIGSLPLDPVNNTTYFYAYVATTTNSGFKLVASGMESTKYGFGGGNDVVSTDGGNSTSSYEVGTNVKL